MSLGVAMVVMRWSLFAGVMGRSLMSWIVVAVLFALQVWIALRWALVVFKANPSDLKVCVSL